MPAKRLLYFSSSQVSAFAWNAGTLTRDAVFANGDEALPEFGKYVAIAPHALYYLLVDIVEEDFHPHRHSQKPLGDHLGRRRRRPGPLSGALAGPLITTPWRHTAIDDGLDLHLFRIFRTARHPRQAAGGTDALGFRQLARRIRADGQVAIIPAAMAGLTLLLATWP